MIGTFMAFARPDARVCDKPVPAEQPGSQPPSAAVPLGDDVLDPAYHRHAGVDRPWIGIALGIGVVPDQQRARLGLDLQAEVRKSGRAAFLDRVEVSHRGDRALPAALFLLLPVRRAAGEPVAMRLELLAGQVALAL